MRFGARSQRGPHRAVNDDHYLILRLGRHMETLMTNLCDGDTPGRFEEFAYGMVVADGIGVGGDVASALAITTLSELAVLRGKWNLRIDEPIAEEVLDRGVRFYRDIDSMLVRAGRRGEPGLQTTLTVVYTAGSELFFAHVGHSRAYLFRDGKLLQLTRDHTVAGERRRGAAAEALNVQARDRPHALTETIGKGGPGPRVDVERCGLLDGDVVLLCTNGLTDVVAESHIANELRQPRTPDDQCRALVDLAMEANGEDDVTVVVAYYRFPD